MNTAQAIKTNSRDEWLAVRRRGIGGSDVGAILGVSPWKTPLDVYFDKIGESDPGAVDDGPDTPIYWGNVLEDLVAEEYAKRTGHKIRRVNRTLIHPEISIAIANLDRLVVSHPAGPGALECKTARAANDAWGDHGTDEVPDYYLAQVVHYLGVTGYKWADLAVLFLADREFRIYHIERDDDLIESILSTEQQWWRDHIEARVPPPPMSAEDMLRLWPRDNGKQVVASPDVEAACRELANLKAQLKESEKHKTELEESIKEHMADAAVLIDPTGKPLATWKAAKDSVRTDWKAIANAISEHVDNGLFGTVSAEHTSTVPGSRRFLLKTK
jgi:putative phage-type endonuclease